MFPMPLILNKRKEGIPHGSNLINVCPVKHLHRSEDFIERSGKTHPLRRHYTSFKKVHGCTILLILRFKTDRTPSPKHRKKDAV
jgi:hypothetical protein